MFKAERNGVSNVSDADGNLVAQIERLKAGTSVIVYHGETGAERKVFEIVEEKSPTGGVFTRSVGSNGYETIHYEA